MALFEVKPHDRRIYEEEIRDFLPDNIIDIHTHVWLGGRATPKQAQAGDIKAGDNKARDIEAGDIEAGDDAGRDILKAGVAALNVAKKRTVTWPGLVAGDNSIEDLNETYRLLLPDKKVVPMIFGSAENPDDLPAQNAYIRDSARRFGYPALFYSHPDMDCGFLEDEIIKGGFAGVKSYLSFAPGYIPEGEIRCYDFFPPRQLKVIDKLGLIAMLHIPRTARLRDRVNLAQILDIKLKFPNIKLIVAHVGRAYCEGDIGEAFDILKPAGDLLFDFSANCNQQVFERLIDAVGPERILFGSDMPILRMRTRRIDEGGNYINLIPPGLYGDPSQDAHLREVSAREAEDITFFFYEEILAMKRAAAACGLDKTDVYNMLFGNAVKILKNIKKIM